MGWEHYSGGHRERPRGSLQNVKTLCVCVCVAVALKRWSYSDSRGYETYPALQENYSNKIDL